MNHSVVAPGVAEVDVLNAQPQRRAAEWFRYFDNNLGRVRRISVNGSAALIHQVADLHDEGKWDELLAFEEQCVSWYSLMDKHHDSQLLRSHDL